MRTIKFRGKRLSDGEWIYGYYLVNRGEHFIVQDEVVDPFATSDDYLVDPDTIGQLTGATDNRGKPLWEGDVIGVVDTEYDSTEYLSLQYIDDKAGYFAKGHRNGDLPITELDTWYSYFLAGNIHDKPELLQVGNCKS